MATITSRKKLYSDLDLSLLIHPIRNDVIPLRDIDAIKNSVRNLIASNYYDRPFRPALGCNVYASLFEPLDRFSKIQLSNSISETLYRYEPRIKDIKVSINDTRNDDNAISIEISFTIKENRETADVEIIFRRYR